MSEVEQTFQPEEIAPEVQTPLAPAYVPDGMTASDFTALPELAQKALLREHERAEKTAQGFVQQSNEVGELRKAVKAMEEKGNAPAPPPTVDPDVELQKRVDSAATPIYHQLLRANPDAIDPDQASAYYAEIARSYMRPTIESAFAQEQRLEKLQLQMESLAGAVAPTAIERQIAHAIPQAAIDAGVTSAEVADYIAKSGLQVNQLTAENIEYATALTLGMKQLRGGGNAPAPRGAGLTLPSVNVPGGGGTSSTSPKLSKDEQTWVGVKKALGMSEANATAAVIAKRNGGR